jgi:hypothetical protein
MHGATEQLLAHHDGAAAVLQRATTARCPWTLLQLAAGAAQGGRRSGAHRAHRAGSKYDDRARLYAAAALRSIGTEKELTPASIEAPDRRRAAPRRGQTRASR